jgi:dTDP-4-amino-4,6-dideoxygalactose transaminase
MATAISRYGSRVIPTTQQIIAGLERRGELLEGPHVTAFEAAFSRRVEDRSAISTSYGRMAFYYLLKAFAFPAGSEIVFPALTFWVVPEIARVLGLTPVFADVDPETFNLTPASFKRAITAKTVAVVPTHLWGLPCDMDKIAGIASRHGIVVIEDCAHALGARFRGRPVGTLGDAAFFSFQMIKPLNTYGGGMAVARDPVLARRVKHLAASAPLPTLKTIKEKLWRGRVQRIATRPRIFTWTLFPAVYVSTRFDWSIDMIFWEPIRPLDPLPADYHARYANVQAAIGLEGLEHLDHWQRETERHAARLSAVLSRVPGVRVPTVPSDRTHAFYQYSAYVPARDTVVDRCLRRGVDIETLHVDVCTALDLFRASGTASPGADETTQAIQIPVYESLTDPELDRVAAVVRDAVESVTMADTPLAGASRSA